MSIYGPNIYIESDTEILDKYYTSFLNEYALLQAITEDDNTNNNTDKVKANFGEKVKTVVHKFIDWLKKIWTKIVSFVTKGKINLDNVQMKANEANMTLYPKLNASALSSDYNTLVRSYQEFSNSFKSFSQAVINKLTPEKYKTSDDSEADKTIEQIHNISKKCNEAVSTFNIKVNDYFDPVVTKVSGRENIINKWAEQKKQYNSFNIKGAKDVEKSINEDIKRLENMINIKQTEYISAPDSALVAIIKDFIEVLKNVSKALWNLVNKGHKFVQDVASNAQVRVSKTDDKKEGETK